MAQTQLYTELETRLNELRIHMLPDPFSPTGTYDDKELDLAKGYILLAHAEFESYIEEVSKNHIIDMVSQWKRNSKLSVSLLSFLCCYHSSWSINDEQSNEDIIRIAKTRNNVKDSAYEVVDLALKQYMTKVKDNNGIKESNFKTLVLPTGIMIDELDSTLLDKLDLFGISRGDIAHLSKKRVTKQLNPQDEYNNVNFILNALKDFDLKLQACKV